MGDQPYRDEAEEPRDIAGEWADLVCDFHDDVSDACSDNSDLAANYITLLEGKLATVTAERDALRAEVEAAWTALGVSPDHRATNDDPDCETLAQCIRIEVEYRCDERDTASGRVKWLEDIIGAEESDVRRQLDTARAALAALRAAAKVALDDHCCQQTTGNDDSPTGICGESVMWTRFVLGDGEEVMIEVCDEHHNEALDNPMNGRQALRAALSENGTPGDAEQDSPPFRAPGIDELKARDYVRTGRGGKGGEHG